MFLRMAQKDSFGACDESSVDASDTHRDAHDMNQPRPQTIQIDAETWHPFKEACLETGRDPTALVATLIQWFLEQDKSTRTLIIGQIHPEDRSALALIILERIVKQASTTQN